MAYVRLREISTLVCFFIFIYDNRYKEIWDYSYYTTESVDDSAIGHFTQLVWKDSQYLGVGIATMKAHGVYGSRYGNLETFIVAMYSPQGNFHRGDRIQAYVDNVKPRIDGCHGEKCRLLPLLTFRLF
ncbi:MAG: hypothetical protein AAFY76_22015 [Cyanobacteria bacterium J06649_11]